LFEIIIVATDPFLELTNGQLQVASGSCHSHLVQGAKV